MEREDRKKRGLPFGGDSDSDGSSDESSSDSDDSSKPRIKTKSLKHDRRQT